MLPIKGSYPFTITNDRKRQNRCLDTHLAGAAEKQIIINNAERISCAKKEEKMGLFKKPDPHDLIEKKGDIEGAIKLLNHRDPEIRRLTVNAMCIYKNEQFIDPLIQTFEKEDNKEVKEEALHALGQYRSIRAIKALCRAYFSDSSCANYVGYCIEDASPHEYAMDEETFNLLRELIDKEINSPHLWFGSIIIGLSHLNDPRCCDIFEKVLSVEKLDISARKSAQTGLVGLGFPGLMAMLKVFFNKKKKWEHYSEMPHPEELFGLIQKVEPQDRKELVALLSDNNDNPAMASLQDGFERYTRNMSDLVRDKIKSIFVEAGIKV